MQSAEKALRVTFSPVGSAVDCFTHTVLRVASASKSSRGNFPPSLPLLLFTFDPIIFFPPFLPNYFFLHSFLLYPLSSFLKPSPSRFSPSPLPSPHPPLPPSPLPPPTPPYPLLRHYHPPPSPSPLVSFTTWLLRAGSGGVATEFCGKSLSEKTVLMKFLQSLLDIQVTEKHSLHVMECSLILILILKAQFH